MDINPVRFSSQLQLSVVALAFGRRSQISYGSCQFAFRSSISVIIASALLSRPGRVLTFLLLSPSFCWQQAALRCAQRYQKISKNIEKGKARKISFQLGKSFIFWALAL